MGLAKVRFGFLCKSLHVGSCAVSSLFLMNCEPAHIAETPQTKRLASEVKRLATTPRSTIALWGEAGVGKQAWARRLHAESARHAAPFVVVPTGAALTADHIVRAHGGALYLRETATLDAESQARLTELLAQGDPDTPRVLAASRAPLDVAVAQGQLNEDLEYRLNVLGLEVPPLRERLGELGALAAHFLMRLAPELGFAVAPTLSPAASARLAEGDWPGNLHELAWTLQGALVGRLGRSGADPGASTRPLNGPLDAFELSLNGQQSPNLSESPPIEGAQGSLEALEEVAVRRALENHAGNRSQAARELGIHRTTLYQKMRRYGLK